MQVKFTRWFGVQASFFQKVTLWGPFTLEMLAICVIGVMIIFMGNNVFVDDKNAIPKIGFNLTVVAATVYSLYKPRTNPKKTNLNLLLLSFKPTTRFFQSISTDNYLQTNSIFAFDVKGPHRLHVSRSDLRG